MKTMTEVFRPLNDAVLLRRFDPADKSKGGLILPDKAQRQEPRGEVIAVGPGRLMEGGKRNPMQVKVGDVVLVGPGSGMCHITLEGHDEKNLFVVDCDGILGIVEEE